MEFNNIEFLKVFILILPGIIGYSIQKNIFEKRTDDIYFSLLFISVLSFVSYSITDCIFSYLNEKFLCNKLNTILIIDKVNEGKSAAIFGENVVCAVLISIILTLILCKLENRGVVFEFCKKIGVVKDYEKGNIWNSMFEEHQRIIFRDLVTENTYFGEVEFYSTSFDDTSKKEIIIKDVRVFDSGSNFLFHSPEIYLSRRYNEFIIEFGEDGNDNQ